MDSYKNFTGHRYECTLSKYTSIFPRWLEFKHISMDFNCCLLLLAQIALISYARIPSRVRMRDDVITVSIYSNRDLNKKAIMAPWESPFHFEFSNSNSSANPVYFKTPFWLMIDNNGPYPQ